MLKEIKRSYAALLRMWNRATELAEITDAEEDWEEVARLERMMKEYRTAIKCMETR